MDALTNVFKAGTGANKGFSTGMLGLGALSNWLAQKRYSGIYNNYNNLLNSYSKMTPEQMSAGIAALQQPLSKNLTSSVGNTVQAQMAEKGLAQAPGVFSTVLAQALAPYEVKNREDAIQAFFQGKQLPIGLNPMAALQTGKPQDFDMSGLWSKLNTIFNPAKQGGGPGISTYNPNPTNATYPGNSQDWYDPTRPQ